jgi:hypothetical protein
MKFHPIFLESVPYMATAKVGDWQDTPQGPIARIDYPNGEQVWFSVNGSREEGIVDTRFAIARPPKRTEAVYDAGGALAVPASCETLEELAAEWRRQQSSKW